MSRKKKEERKTQKGKFKNKLCFLAAAVAAGTITTEDKKLYGGNVCTVRVTGVTTGNPTTLGSAPGTDAIACGDGAIANGMSAIATGKGSFTGYNKAVAIGENATALRESDVAIGAGAGLYNQGLNAKTLPNTASKTRGYNVIIGANAMVGDDNNTSVHTSQGIAIGGSGTTRDAGARKYGDSGGAWAKGDQSIAIGGDTIAEGHSSIAIGGDDLQKAAAKSVTYTLGSGSKTASLLTAMSDLAGVASGDITSFNATKSGSGAVALGVKSISGDLSLAIGTMSKANKVNATAVGTGAVADLDNSVAIGGGATTVNAAGTQETSATINGVTYSNFAGGSGTKVGDVVSLGKNGTFNRQIKNVAAGNISATSTDAVNGSQLYSVAQTLQDRFKYVSINSTETGNADNKGALATNSIAIGPNASATVTSENAVVVGNGAKTTEQVMNSGAPTQWTKTGKNSVVIGNKASTNSEGSVAIGHEAKVDNTTNNSGSTIGRYKNDDNSTYMGTSLAQNNIYADPSYVGTQGIAIGANSYSDYQGMSMGVGARSKNLSLALGYFSNAEGTSSIATGVGAYAKGDNSISSGRQSSTISTGSVALGVAARGGSTADGGLGGSIAVGAASDATHEQAIAIGGITNANTATLEQGRGDNTQATAARATAIGANAKAQAESSIAFGTKASVGSAGTNAVAIGKDSSATVANGVALGSESKATTAAGVTGFDMADGRSNVYSGLAGTAKTANMAAVSVGDGANKTRQITGVAAGKEDTDAVNVAQLKSTNLKIAGNTTSGGADVRLHDQTLTVKGDGTYLTSTAAGNTITMELKQDVKDKIDNAATKKLDNLDPAGVQKIKDTAAWNVVANSGTAEKVQGGDTVKFINGNNIEVTQSGKDFTFATKKDVTFDSVTINNGPKLSSTGIDAGNKKITNVADGTVGAGSKDAVNGGQLHDVKTSVTNNTTALNDLKSNTIKLSGDSTSTTAERLDKNGGIEFGVKSGDTNYLTSTATGTDITLDLTSDTKAKIDKVTTLSNNTISLGGDTGTTNTQALDKTGGIKFNVKGDGTYLTSNATNDDVTLDLTQATKDKINNAATNKLDNLDPAGVQKIKDTAAWNVVANSGTAEKVQGGDTVKFIDGDNIEITQAGKDFTFATKKDVTFDSVTINNGPKLSSTGIDAGNKKISNLADGTANNDAVNLGQLNTAINNAGAAATIKYKANGGAPETVKLSDGLDFVNGSNTTAIVGPNGVVKYDVNLGTLAVGADGKAGADGKTGADGTAGKDGIATTQDVAKAINSSAWKVTSTASTGTVNTPSVEDVKNGDTVKFDAGDNIEITQNGKDFTFATKKDVTFDSVTINNGGPKLSVTGIDAANKKITNVADGAVTATSKDAVNGSQLYGLSKNTVTVSGDSTSTTPQTLDQNGGIKLGIKSGDTQYLTSTATGTDITLDLTPDAKAKINKVATLSSNTISLGGDTGTTNTQSLDKTGGIKFNVKGDGTYLTSNATNDDVTLDLTQATKDKINNAATNKLDNLDPAGIQKIKDTAAWNVVANNGTAEKVEGGNTVKFIDRDNIAITQAGKDFTIATKRDVNFDSVTVPAGAGNVVINNSGINAGNNKITNVADGTIAPGSKDAVNGGQLHDVQNTINAGAFTVSANGGAKDRIAKDENIDFENADGNIAISYDATGNKFTYNLSPNLNLGPAGSLRIGDALLNNGGLTIVNGPSITSAGVDAGNKKITNVADGTIGAGSKDAINGGQLHDVQTNLQTSINNNAQNIANNTNAINNLNTAVNNPITFTGDSGNNIDRKLGETLNIKGGATGNLTSGNIGVEADSTTNTLNVKLAENIDLGTNGSVKMGDTKINDNGLTINGGPSVTKAGIDAGNKKVTNVANGDITATSKDAVNGSQLHGVADSIKNSIGGNTILNPDGTITTNNIGGTGHNNIHDAIASVNNAANQRTTVVAGDNIDVTVSTNATGGNEYTVATKRDIVVDSVSVANNGPSMNSNGINAGGKTISNLGAGVNPNDAVNVAQLDAVKNSPITFGADTGTDHAATLGSRVSITGDNKNITTSISGNNIQVAMSETPSFGTVNINDANTGTITGASNVTLDNLDEDGTVGRVATEAQLAAVRNEVAGTKDIDNKLRGFKRGADAGTASAMAMAGIPQVINPGENAIGASISAYKQQTAVAVGYTRASKNGRAVLKISGSVNSNSELGFSLGFMKGWD